MAEKSHRFLTYAEQIAHLRDKGLNISDEAHAKEVLADIGYYELVNGYKALFKKNGGGMFRAGTTFDDLLALYKADENLRQLCFKYILRIEIRLRSTLSYAFCAQYGTKQEAYLDADNYSDDPDVRQNVFRLVAELRSEAEHNRSVYVAYQRQEYGNVPLWVLFKAVSLGTLVKFYSYADDRVRKKTAAAFSEGCRDDLRCETFERMLGVLLDFRNACAHNNILYTCKSDEQVPPMPVLRYVTFGWDESRLDGSVVYAGNDLFAVFVCFFYLLKPEDFRRASEGFDRITAHFLSLCKSVGEQELLRTMGFPADWKRLADV